MGKKHFSDATYKKLNWAKNLFDEWLNDRNEHARECKESNISVIAVPLEEMTKDELNYSISRFIVEIRKKNGDEYPGETLYELVLAVQQYLQNLGHNHKFLLDEWYSQIRNTLDNAMKQRAAAGIGK